MTTNKRVNPLRDLSALLLAGSVVMASCQEAGATFVPIVPPTAIKVPIATPKMLSSSDADSSALLCAALIVIAEAEQAEGDTENAIKFYKAVLQFRLTLGKPSIEGAIAGGRLANIYGGMNKLAQAEGLAKQVRGDIDILFGPASEAAAVACNNLALIEAKLRHRSEAEALFRRSLRTLEAGKGADLDATAAVQANLAQFYFTAKRLKEAEHQYRDARAKLLKISGEKDPEIQAIESSLNKIRCQRRL